MADREALPALALVVVIEGRRFDLPTVGDRMGATG
jgi:hypothetical protein